MWTAVILFAVATATPTPYAYLPMMMTSPAPIASEQECNALLEKQTASMKEGLDKKYGKGASLIAARCFPFSPTAGPDGHVLPPAQPAPEQFEPKLEQKNFR